jgi:HNH endonuclease
MFYWRSGPLKGTIVAYRLVFEFANNCKLSPTDEIEHTCDNRTCCNPAHLIKVTKKEHDAIERYKRMITKPGFASAHIRSVAANSKKALKMKKEQARLAGLPDKKERRRAVARCRYLVKCNSSSVSSGQLNLF